MPEFKNTDIDDIQYREDTTAEYEDVQEMYINGDGIWSRSGETPGPDYTKNGVIYTATQSATVTSTVTKAGTYTFHLYGGGGGAAMAAWSNSSGTYGGAAVAPGGSGAYVVISAKLVIGDVITLVTGGSGANTKQTYKAVNASVDLHGGKGGGTFVKLQRYVAGHYEYDYRGRSKWVPATTINQTIGYATGGSGGSISMIISSAGDTVQNRVVTGGAGGSMKITSSAYSSYRGGHGGASGVAVVGVDEDISTKTDITVQGNVTGGPYGLGSGGIASKTTTRTTVDLSCTDTYATQYGYQQINIGTDADPEFVLIGDEGYLQMVYNNPATKRF